MNTDLTTATDDDLARLAEAMRDNNEFIGLPLKFKKGKWYVQPEKQVLNEVRPEDKFTVDVLSYANGWIKWVDKRPSIRHVYRPIDGWILPMRERLPDLDHEDWPLDSMSGKRKDPWQEHHQLVLKDKNNELLTWAATSYYGIKGMRKFIEEFTRGARDHRGEMPVVTLGQAIEKSQNYGDIPSPRLIITDWQAFGEGAAPRGAPGVQRLPSAAAISVQSHKQIEADFSASDEPVERRAEYDDEIPF